MLFEKIRGIIVELMAVEKDRVTADADFKSDLDADSLDMVKLFDALRKRLSQPDRVIEITEADTESIETVQQVIDMLKSKGLE